MKKVIQLITRLDKGGSAELVLQTCAKLVENGHEVLLISGKTENPPFDIKQYSEKHGFRLIIVGELIRNIHPIKDLLAFWKVRKLLQNESPDILHTNTSKAGFIGRIAGHSVGIKKIFHSPHGHIFYGYYSTLVTNIFILMEKIAAKYSTNIFNLTEKGRQDHILRNIASPEKFIVSSCGIDLHEFTTNQIKSISEKNIKILWIGRFVPIKNPKMVLNVANHFDSNNIEFRMVGDGELFDNIQKEIEVQNIKNVVLTGYQSDLKDEFSSADIFIITSINEGFGRVIVEAMAAGLPVIATKVGGIPELIDNNINGYLVDSNNYEEMAKKITQLLDYKDIYAQISKNNIKKSKDYSLDNYIRNITNYY